METSNNEPPNTTSAVFPSSAPLSTLHEWLNLPVTTTADSLLQSLDSQQYVHDFWQKRTRPDGRLFSQGRPCQMIKGALEHAAGSALVTCTSTSSAAISTKVLAATTLQIGHPSPEQPDRGDIVVQVTGSGGHNLGTDLFKSKGGSGGKSWDVLQAWLQRTLEEQDDAIASRLNLLTGKAALRLVVTVHILEHGGNLQDAALLACMAAWHDTRLPEVGKHLVEVQGTLYWKDEAAMTQPNSNSEMSATGKRPCDYRVSLTMGVWKDPKDRLIHLLVDPSLQEEPLLEGTLTMTIGLSSGRIQAQYSGSASLKATDMAFAAKLVQARADELVGLLAS